MKKMIKQKLGFLLLLVIASAAPVLTYAQDPGDDPDVPIDGGLSVLVAAGIGYGLKKYRDDKKSKKNIEL